MPDGPPTLTSHPAVARRGRLELSFSRAPDGRTYVDRQFSSYPFHVCRPFYLDDGPAAGMATIYTQSCSGGLYTEDRLVTEVSAGDGAQVHLTTQASTIVHRSTRGPARQETRLRAGEDALLEYTPSPTILLPQAHLESTTLVELAPTASAILFDSFLAHDHEGGADPFAAYSNELQVVDLDGKPLATERFRLTGAEFAGGGTGRMAGYLCHGSFLCFAPHADIDATLAEARSATGGIEGALVGVSALPGDRGISGRVIARDAVDLNATLGRLWQVARRAITGASPSPRRK